MSCTIVNLFAQPFHRNWRAFLTHLNAKCHLTTTSLLWVSTLGQHTQDSRGPQQNGQWTPRTTLENKLIVLSLMKSTPLSHGRIHQGHPKARAVLKYQQSSAILHRMSNGVFRYLETQRDTRGSSCKAVSPVISCSWLTLCQGAERQINPERC
jgi:hypothetical protein